MNGWGQAHPTKIVIAASFNYRKMFFLDCEDGMMYVAAAGMRSLIPCVPDNGARQKLGLLEWLEEHSNRHSKLTTPT